MLGPLKEVTLHGSNMHGNGPKYSSISPAAREIVLAWVHNQTTEKLYFPCDCQIKKKNLLQHVISSKTERNDGSSRNSFFYIPTATYH